MGVEAPTKVQGPEPSKDKAPADDPNKDLAAEFEKHLPPPEPKPEPATASQSEPAAAPQPEQESAPPSADAQPAAHPAPAHQPEPPAGSSSSAPADRPEVKPAGSPTAADAASAPQTAAAVPPAMPAPDVAEQAAPGSRSFDQRGADGVKLANTQDTVNAQATALDPLGDARSKVDQLNSARDKAIFSRIDEYNGGVDAGPVAVAAKMQEGTEIQVEQIGGADPSAPADGYGITLTRRHLDGLNGKASVDKMPGLSKAGLKLSDGMEANGIVEDNVKIQVKTKDEAIRVTNSLLADLKGQGSPSQQDEAFINSHITEISQVGTTQIRNKVASAAPNLKVGAEHASDQNFYTKEVIKYGPNGQPAEYTYAVGHESETLLKDGPVIEGGGKTKAKGALHSIGELDSRSTEVTIGYELPQGEKYPAPSYTSKVDDVLNPDPWLGPRNPLFDKRPDGSNPANSAKVTTTTITPTQAPAPFDRVDHTRTVTEVTVQNPSLSKDDLLFIDPAAKETADQVARSGQPTGATTVVDRIESTGVHFQPEGELSGGAKKLGVKASYAPIFEQGVDDVISPAPAQPQPQPQPQPQHVVAPAEGLNIRAAPGTDSAETGAFQHGEFLQPTGEASVDRVGRAWKKVTGRDVQNRLAEGWVASDQIFPHEDGAADDTGRINPDISLERHIVEPGDNAWDVAREKGVDYKALLELNGLHVIEQARVFPGDKLYIPNVPA